jgi:dTDP-4-dehydrorhamnose reductase
MSQKEKKKILITGALGMLGKDLVSRLKEEYILTETDIGELDITKGDSVRKIVKENPDFIIHTAAYTDVDGCEKNKEKAYAVNGEGTKNCCLGARELDIPLVYISTDYIFDGKKKEPYVETDKPSPLSIYGKTKLQGEKYVERLLNKFYIIRTSWLYGKYGKNFVYSILKQNGRLRVVDEEIGAPTYTKDLAATISQLLTFNFQLSTAFYGIYHITNSDYTSWYGFAKEICNLAGKNVEIIPIKSGETGRIAERPKNSRLSNSLYKERYGKSMRCWKEALKEFLGEIL